MKRGKYLLVVLLAGLVACTNDNLVPDGNGGLPTGGKELENIIFNVPDLEFDGPQTRGLYEDSESGMKYRWMFGDTIGIFSSKGSQVVFPLASSSGTNTAIFDGKGWGMKVGETYQAYFPYSYYNRDLGRIEYDYSEQTQFALDSPVYTGSNNKWVGLCEHDFMISEPTTPTDNTLNIKLKRVSAILRVDVSLSNTIYEQDIAPLGMYIEEASLHVANNQPLKIQDIDPQT